MERTVLGVAGIKSLYTNISHDFGLEVLDYWIEKLKHKMEQLQRFSKNFILNGMSLILKYNYFYINDSFIHQIKGTAMSTYAAIAHTILQVLNYVTGIIIYDLTGIRGVKLFNKLTYDIVEFVLQTTLGF